MINHIHARPNRTQNLSRQCAQIYLYVFYIHTRIYVYSTRLQASSPIFLLAKNFRATTETIITLRFYRLNILKLNIRKWCCRRKFINHTQIAPSDSWGGRWGRHCWTQECEVLAICHEEEKISQYKCKLKNKK